MTTYTVTISNGAGQPSYAIPIFDTDFDFGSLRLPIARQSVNILAAGASINDLTPAQFEKIAAQPCIFVNGSFSLTKQYKFHQPVAYVITDSRFIRHNLAILQNTYRAECPLFMTQSMLLALLNDCPDFIRQFWQSLCLIYAVDRPILQARPSGLFGKLGLKFGQKLGQKKLGFSQISTSPFHVFQEVNRQTMGKDTVGVSLDMRHGFVEAGTVAYVAAQLAFSLGFREIRLFGVDLLNANQPRFYETTQTFAPNKLATAVHNRIVPAFDLLAQVYHQHGVQVKNASPVSKDLFQNIPFFTL